VQFNTTIEIEAPSDKVWSTLVDVEHWPDWTASMREVKIVYGSSMARGTRVRIKQPRMPTVTWEVTDLQPGVSFEWRNTAPGIESIGIHTAESIGADRTAVTLGFHQSGPLAPVMGLLASGTMRRYVLIEAAGLKKHCQTA
jgi:uncharacterized membrane protein